MAEIISDLNNKRAWYVYNGLGFSIETLSNFTLIDGIPGCLDGSQLCSIYAAYGGTNPLVISDNLKKYISNGLSKFIAQPDLPINSKIFVTMKNLT